MNSDHSLSESESIRVNAGTYLDRQLRETRRENKFIKVEDGNCLDVVLYPNDRSRNKIVDGMFHKEPTGRKKNLFLTHEIFLDDSKLQELEISMKSAARINEYLQKMGQDVCPVRLFREGKGTDTKYRVQALRLVENEIPS